MADLKKLEGMIDSTPIMKDFADIESSKLPEYQIDSKIPEGPVADKCQEWRICHFPTDASFHCHLSGQSRSRIHQ